MCQEAHCASGICTSDTLAPLSSFLLLGLGWAHCAPGGSLARRDGAGTRGSYSNNWFKGPELWPWPRSLAALAVGRHKVEVGATFQGWEAPPPPVPSPAVIPSQICHSRVSGPPVHLYLKPLPHLKRLACMAFFL